jgi:hypothetical protein
MTKRGKSEEAHLDCPDAPLPSPLVAAGAALELPFSDV